MDSNNLTLSTPAPVLILNATRVCALLTMICFTAAWGASEIIPSLGTSVLLAAPILAAAFSLATLWFALGSVRWSAIRFMDLLWLSLFWGTSATVLTHAGWLFSAGGPALILSVMMLPGLCRRARIIRKASLSR